MTMPAASDSGATQGLTPQPVVRLGAAGHRPHGTGFRERFIAPYQPKEAKPCVHCKELTDRWVWTAVQWVARSEFAVEWTPVCEPCEAQRVAAQRAVYRGPQTGEHA